MIDIDRDGQLVQHKVVCWLMARIAWVAFAISRNIHLPFLRLGEIVVNVHTRRAGAASTILTEYIAELERERDILKTREAWLERNQ